LLACGFGWPNVPSPLPKALLALPDSVFSSSSVLVDDRAGPGVPVPVLTTALYERFASQGEAHYQDKLLSAMRFGFGGHLEKTTPDKQGS
jgi:6-phosphogluconate dehydrogenase (decarboxylating)